MREDILRGLKNAIERGESLEKAAQSFINAGYNSMEVKQAAQNLLGASYMVGPSQVPGAAPSSATQQIQKIPQNSPPAQFPNKTVKNELPQRNIPAHPKEIPVPLPMSVKKLNEFQPMQMSKPQKGNTSLIIVLLVILILLLGGLIAMLLYGQDLLEFIFGA